MSHYRIYILDRGDHITAVEEVDFESDEQATEHARGLLAAHGAVELWSGTRWVDHLRRAPKELTAIRRDSR